MFENATTHLLKPNVVEFVRFLRYAGILHDSDAAESEKIRELKLQVVKGDFKETIELAKEFMKRFQFKVKTILVSFSEHGSLIINPRYAVHVGAPEIKLECSSGAGDSGLANVIVTAKKRKIDLNSDLNDAELEELARAFNYAASATATLPGNQIADANQVSDLVCGVKVRSVCEKLAWV